MLDNNIHVNMTNYSNRIDYVHKLNKKNKFMVQNTKSLKIKL